MNLIEAGKICRDAGFNWGRGSWWADGNGSSALYGFVTPPNGFYPDLSKGATRGVILDWAREMTGLEINVFVHSEFDEYCWSVRGGAEYKPQGSEIECYAKLCQWVKENRK